MVNVTVVINPKEVTGFHGAINTKNRPLCTTADSCCHTAAHLGRLLKDILGIIGRFRQLLFLPQSCNSYTHSQEKNDHSQPSYYRCNRPDYTLQSSWYPEVKWPRPLYTPSGQNSPQEISNKVPVRTLIKKSFHCYIIHKSMNQTWQYTIANIRCDKYWVHLYMDSKLLAVRDQSGNLVIIPVCLGSKITYHWSLTWWVT